MFDPTQPAPRTVPASHPAHRCGYGMARKALVLATAQMPSKDIENSMRSNRRSRHSSRRIEAAFSMCS